jgi:peptide/nickel transport system permease protein
VKRRRGSLVADVSWIGWTGIACTALVVALALLGPLVAPHPPTELVGDAFAPPSGEFPLGLDYLGRDALSRFLHGGRTAILLAFLATMLGLVVGVVAGLGAAYARGWVDAVFNRTTEVALAFPSLIVILLLVTGVGTELWLVVVAVGATHEIGRAHV